ncbi:SRPBCC family protein [Planctomyces sp. SH-PL62]|uniref:SRPBCC family protein n=1 Tax=Planctomyces sp. SH-PL62 TaxID=1636152 RepID=UPI00078DA891|nr:SRPBCC family protein [Planctomyces sp. SH-PL62]AMV39178.1 Polyketide cyclase / dehydrase and lipid transport [Planctomyces sp. SH-PL62]
MQRFIMESRIAAPPDAVFAFFERPDAFQLLVPPDEPVEVVEAPRSLEVGARAVIRMRVGPFPVEWVAEHIEYIPGRLFVDRQVKGPFAAWVHRHEFLDDGEGGTLLRDVVAYQPPLGLLGGLVAGPIIESKLRRLFEYRHEVVKKAFEQTEGDAAEPA